jgi:potassium channel subfamily K
MARTVRFSIAQPITVGGWWISALTLTGLCATASGPLKLPDPETQEFSQAFYYAIISAALYFLVAILMTITVIGALAGKYEKNFQLTMSQRTLMLQTISLLVYLEISALIFSHVEGWSFLDAV